MIENSKVIKRDGEQSFTIFETLVALGVLMAVVLEVVGTQGNITSFASYARQSTEAIWLAKRMMAQVEYQWHHRELKELDMDQKEQPFKIEGMEDQSDYTYTMKIQEWKLPIFDLLSNGGLQGESQEEEDTEQAPNPMSSGLAGAEQLINQLFDGHILKTAHIEVFWPEGARRNSVTLTMLLTNQRALDNYIVSKAKVFERMQNDIEEDLNPKKKNEKKSNRDPADPNRRDGGRERNPDAGL